MNITRIYKKLLLILETIEMVCFIVLFITIIIQVFFRLKPIATRISYYPVWTEELSRWLFVYIVFFGTILATFYREHIGFDVFIKKCPAVLQGMIQCLIDILMLFCTIIIIWFGVQSTLYASRQVALTLPFSKGVLYSVVPISFSLMAVCIIFLLIQDCIHLKSLYKGREQDVVDFRR